MNHSIVWAVFVLCLLTACCRESDPPTPEPEEPLVRNGQMYALVNGVEWRTCGPVTVSVTLAQIFEGDYFDLGGQGICNRREVYFKIFGFIGEGEYILGGSSASYAIFSGNNEYYTDSTHSGLLIVERLDSVATDLGTRPHKVSGSFWFNAIHKDSGDTISITNGKFQKIDVLNF